MSFDIRAERHLDTSPDVGFHHWTDDARRAWYRGDESDWVVHVETGYPTADIRDALLRNGAAQGLGVFRAFCSQTKHTA